MRTIPPGDVVLRATAEADVAVFYGQQSDPTVGRLAVPPDPAAFAAKWAKHLANPDNTLRTVLFDGRVAGHVVCFTAPWSGRREIGYWVGKEFWGRGIATRAVGAFLSRLAERPLFARADVDNAASLRVLEKNGFVRTGRETRTLDAGGGGVEEVLFELRPGQVPGVHLRET